MGIVAKTNDVVARLEAASDFQLISIGEGSLFLEVMIYGGALRDLRPFLILHSLEYPMPPSEAFCAYMAEAGYQVIFVRRNGFGASTPLHTALYDEYMIQKGSTAGVEAIMIRRLIEQLDLRDFVLMVLGSANPMGYRLTSICPRIRKTLLINPMLNEIVWTALSPDWFRNMMKEVVKNRSGMWLAYRSLRLLIQRDPVGFYKKLFHASPGDLQYVEDNAAAYEAAGGYLMNLDSLIFYAEANINLSADPMLSDDAFASLNVTVCAGADSSQNWRDSMHAEARRLGAPFRIVPMSDLCCGYSSPEFLVHHLAQAHSVYEPD